VPSTLPQRRRPRPGVGRGRSPRSRESSHGRLCGRRGTPRTVVSGRAACRSSRREPLHLLQLCGTHPPEAPLTDVKGLVRDPHLPAELRHRRPSLYLPQGVSELLLAELDFLIPGSSLQRHPKEAVPSTWLQSSLSGGRRSRVSVLRSASSSPDQAQAWNERPEVRPFAEPAADPGDAAAGTRLPSAARVAWMRSSCSASGRSHPSSAGLRRR
jgi:hypothetical protein